MLRRTGMVVAAGVAFGGATLAQTSLGGALGDAVPPAAAGPKAEAPAVSVYAAGSLREALTEVAAAHTARTGTPIALTFGASGLLRERIERGETAMVFASADTQHPERLARSGAWQSPQVFVRNALCALTAPTVAVTPATLLDTLLSPGLRLGTSTPGSDPSGDYTWALFRKAEALQPGAFARLDAKAMKLTGAADSPKAPPGQGTYAWVMSTGQADLFITYCTNAVAAQREVPALGVTTFGPELQVAAAYGLTVRAGAAPEAAAFAQSLLAPATQQVFAKHGFAAP